MLQQRRPKWATPSPNVQVGGVVMIKDDNAPRNVWPLSPVTAVEADDKGFVRAVELKTKGGHLHRPDNKTCACT